MGPRLFSRGNRASDQDLSQPGGRAASMGPRLFSRGNGKGHPAYQARVAGFNGATTFQPWKLLKPATRYYVRLWMLQWGHDFSAVEIFSDFQAHEAFCASMGPRLFSRGNTLHYLARDTTIKGGLQWGHDFSAVEMTAFWASFRYSRIVRLQWGHDFSAVEITAHLVAGQGSSPGFNGATTFQPWKLSGRRTGQIPR